MAKNNKHKTQDMQPNVVKTPANDTRKGWVPEEMRENMSEPSRHGGQTRQPYEAEPENGKGNYEGTGKHSKIKP